LKQNGDTHKLLSNGTKLDDENYYSNSLIKKHFYSSFVIHRHSLLRGYSTFPLMKKIILGISGSIAAYKAATLTRLLIKSGAEVQVLMTPNAAEFISPLTLATLSKREVLSSVISEKGWNNHVELGLWADAMIIAPATATTLAKMANGICDNILTATYLSARCPVFVAPAMDLDMWKHPATKRNIQLLESYDVKQLPVGYGELASGLVGEGRMAEPEDIIAHLNIFFAAQQDWKGKKIVITAGPTYEAIDPVRFVGNRSSGKMGIAIADELADRGAEVVLVLGPSRLSPKNGKIILHRVESAQEMYDVCLSYFPQSDAAILSAAVADYRPVEVAGEKIKKKGEYLDLRLVKNPDIAATLGAMKQPNQVLVGFALETNDELNNAIGKIERKNLDFIVLNSLRDAGAGFGGDTNKVTIVDKYNKIQDFELKTKEAVAKDIIEKLKEYFK
jgi:phosphopantothenoylcysteine decarboxylase / phosphopantothenate---cysteine ligase